MFWHMTGLSAASPVETILDKENFTFDELLDEDEIIQECKALNGRLINFLRERAQIKKLIQYIVEDAPEEAEKERTFKLPFIACEIFTCEVDIILKALVEDEELMDLLFSFLDHDRSHSTLLAGYFSKTCDEVQRRWPACELSPNWCCLCKRNEESQDHILLHCEFSSQIWHKAFKILNLIWAVPDKAKDMYIVEPSLPKGRKHLNFWFIVVHCTMWSIWLERNSRIFEDKQNTVDETGERLKFRVATWMLLQQKYEHLSVLDLSRDWNFVFQ